jgi:hypothetical protein
MKDGDQFLIKCDRIPSFELWTLSFVFSYEDQISVFIRKRLVLNITTGTQEG